MRMDILYQFNEKYAPYAGASITSLFINNSQAEEIVVWILGEELSADSISRLEHLAEEYHRTIRFVETDGLVSKMKELNMPTYRGSYAANMRLFLPAVLPKEVERILYLDADTIVDADIQEFYDTVLNDCALAMVMDSLGRNHKQDIGLKIGEPYYNSGVILFDMKEWRKQGLTEKIVTHVQQVRAHYPAPDQDLLNVVCKGKILKLSPRYNFQPVHMAFSIKQYIRVYSDYGYYTETELKEAAKQPQIYHFFRFLGEFPWHQNTCHPDAALFDSYLRQSPWADYEKKPAEADTVLRIEKRLYQLLPRFVFLYLFKLSHSLFLGQANRQSLQKKIHKEM